MCVYDALQIVKSNEISKTVTSICDHRCSWIEKMFTLIEFYYFHETTVGLYAVFLYLIGETSYDLFERTRLRFAKLFFFF